MFHRPESPADNLILLLKEMRRTRNVVIDGTGMDGVDLARVATAKAMEQRGSAFLFRASYERWDMERINRELF